MGPRDEKLQQECWKLLTIGEKTLLFLLIGALTFFLALFIYIVHLQLYARNVCETPICVKTAAKILQKMEFTANPCTNFSQFICGDTNDGGLTLTSNDIIKAKKMQFLAEPWNENSILPIVTIKKFYQVCTNTDLNETEYKTTLLAMLEEIGGWPLLQGQNWSEDSFNWLNFIVVLRDFGFETEWFFNFELYSLDDINLLQIKPPSLQKVTDDKKWSNLEAMVNVVVELGSSTEFAWDAMKKVQDFEQELVQIAEKSNNESREDPTENNVKITVKQLNQFWPKISLVNILNHLAKSYTIFTHKTELILSNKNYIYSLNTLLQKTAKRTQANYIIWKIIVNFIPFLSRDIQEKYNEQTKTDRETICFDQVTQRFYGDLEAEFYNKQTSSKTTQSLKTITNLIKGASIDGEFKSPATDVTITEVDNLVDEFSIDFGSDNFLKMLNEIQFRLDNQFYACLNKNASWCPPSEPNNDVGSAYFDPILNSIVLAPEILYKTFDMNLPSYVNFGRIGRIFGDIFVDLHRTMNISMVDARSGIELAYVGYLRWIGENGVEPSLPGLNYTNKQLFWMSSAALFCSFVDLGQRTEGLDEIANSDYFQQEFQCVAT